MNCQKCQRGVMEEVGELMLNPVTSGIKAVEVECPVKMFVCSLDICSSVELVAENNFLSDLKKKMGSNYLVS